MALDDLKKIFMSPMLFRLDTVLSTRLVPILYGVGMAAILLWAISHLFFMFGFGFSNGLWGLLEVLVFGLLGMLVLRIVAEGILVFFKSNEAATYMVATSRLSSNLLDEVRDAIHDLAEDDLYENGIASGTDPTPLVSEAGPEGDGSSRGPIVKRTARRTPAARD
ncbi:MAG: hypothetical protein JWR75_386 [Devosia sp.]|nr:hypothetical protein [Devosia sp.]